MKNTVPWDRVCEEIRQNGSVNYFDPSKVIASLRLLRDETRIAPWIEQVRFDSDTMEFFVTLSEHVADSQLALWLLELVGYRMLADENWLEDKRTPAGSFVWRYWWD